MSKVFRLLELLLLVILLGFGALFVSFMNLYGAFLLLVTLAIGVGVYRRQLWGYFAAAAWGLASYQLAKQGYEFAQFKSAVMLLGMLVVVIAIILHEMQRKSSEKTGR
jgi:hypothetical protein